MQLQVTVCRGIKAVIWSLSGAFLECRGFWFAQCHPQAEIGKTERQNVWRGFGQTEIGSALRLPGRSRDGNGQTQAQPILT